MSRFRRLARDYERLPGTLTELRYLAFIILMLKERSGGTRLKLITGSRNIRRFDEKRMPIDLKSVWRWNSQTISACRKDALKSELALETIYCSTTK
jgi:hypothetical protein